MCIRDTLTVPRFCTVSVTSTLVVPTCWNNVFSKERSQYPAGVAVGVGGLVGVAVGEGCPRGGIPGDGVGVGGCSAVAIGVIAGVTVGTMRVSSGVDVGTAVGLGSCVGRLEGCAGLWNSAVPTGVDTRSVAAGSVPRATSLPWHAASRRASTTTVVRRAVVLIRILLFTRSMCSDCSRDALLRQRHLDNDSVPTSGRSGELNTVVPTHAHIPTIPHKTDVQSHCTVTQC